MVKINFRNLFSIILTKANLFEIILRMENKLNKIKLRMELARINKNRSWLAKQLGFKSRQAFFHYWKSDRTDQVQRIADILQIDPNDLVIRN